MSEIRHFWRPPHASRGWVSDSGLVFDELLTIGGEAARMTEERQSPDDIESYCDERIERVQPLIDALWNKHCNILTESAYLMDYADNGETVCADPESVLRVIGSFGVVDVMGYSDTPFRDVGIMINDAHLTRDPLDVNIASGTYVGDVFQPITEATWMTWRELI